MNLFKLPIIVPEREDALARKIRQVYDAFDAVRIFDPETVVIKGLDFNRNRRVLLSRSR